MNFDMSGAMSMIMQILPLSLMMKLLGGSGLGFGGGGGGGIMSMIKPLLMLSILPAIMGMVGGLGGNLTGAPAPARRYV